MSWSAPLPPNHTSHFFPFPPPRYALWSLAILAILSGWIGRTVENPGPSTGAGCSAVKGAAPAPKYSPEEDMPDSLGVLGTVASAAGPNAALSGVAGTGVT